MKPMDILFDHQAFALQRAGGISRVFLELARELALAPECRLHWYRGFHQDVYDVAELRGRLAGYWGCVWRPPGLRHSELRRLNAIGLRCFGRFGLRRYDVYHPSYYDDSLLDLVVARRLVVTIHDMIPERFLSGMERFQRLVLSKKRLVERADVVLSVSESTKRDVIEILGTPVDKVRVVPNATRIHEVPAADLPIPPGGRRYFLYVGTRSKYKNFDVLLAAYAQCRWLRDFDVVCFGGTHGYLEHERAFLAKHGIEDRFLYFTGDDRLLRALYDNALALVYTSRYEGFGLPVLEAMACACPVVCTQVSALPEVVGDAALFFEPDRAESLVERLRQVAGDTNLRRSLIAGGLQRARNFSWRHSSQAVLAAYQEACT
jgi:glycosyltransferase involved in cell wall biosynthesis